MSTRRTLDLVDGNFMSCSVKRSGLSSNAGVSVAVIAKSPGSWPIRHGGKGYNSLIRHVIRLLHAPFFSPS